jgi:hypothetical protein
MNSSFFGFQYVFQLLVVLFFVTKFKSINKINSVCSSYAEPFAMLKKCLNSLFEFLPAPSAIF